MKHVFALLAIFAHSSISLAQATTVLECVGEQNGSIVISSLLEDRAGTRFIKVESLNSKRFFYVENETVAAALTIEATEIDSRTGAVSGSQATLQVPQVEMNNGLLRIDGDEMIVKCSRVSGRGGYRAL